MDLTSVLPVSNDWYTRALLQRSIAALYLNAFVIALNQAPALIGERGLLPIRLFLSELRFWQAPSLLWLNPTNLALSGLAWCGIALSLLALTGISERFGIAGSMAVWCCLWLLYLSLVNVGQTFYGFGWETLLLETGFLVIFFGPATVAPSALMPWLLRWLLFRVMFGAGMIKLRGDACWRDLTCMFYHYETQPLPNPLSWFFHRLPGWLHRGEVLTTHVVELVVPFGYFAPPPLRYIAGAVTILFQLTLILSGNLSWLNYITIVIAFACFDDHFFAQLWPLPAAPEAALVPWLQQGAMGLLVLVVAVLSIRPALNLISPGQMMNASFEPLHLVNTYGAFGSITRVRREVILEGTADDFPGQDARWRPYEFKCKPGSIERTPGVLSPYHFKLDWQMWFAAMSPYWNHPWLLHLVAKLLKNDAPTLSLMAGNPFPEAPPKYIRAELYEYRMTQPRSPAEVAGFEVGRWWERRRLAGYLPPLSLHTEAFMKVLQERGWDD